MARPRPRHVERWLAPPVLGLLAALIGVLLANASPATHISSAVQVDAERAVAARMVLGGAEEQFAARSAQPPPPQTYPLLDGEQTVRLASAGAKAVFSGDLMHAPIQCRHPEWRARPDYDPAEARATRRAFLERYCDTDVLVCTMHFPLPSAGHVVPHGDAFDFRYDDEKW